MGDMVRLVYNIGGARVPPKVVRVVVCRDPVTVADFQPAGIWAKECLSDENVHTNCAPLRFVAQGDLRIPSTVDVLPEDACLVVYDAVGGADSSRH